MHLNCHGYLFNDEITMTFIDLFPAVCKFKAHKRCAVRSTNNCKWTTLASIGNDIIEDEEGVSYNSVREDLSTKRKLTFHFRADKLTRLNITTVMYLVTQDQRWQKYTHPLFE